MRTAIWILAFLSMSAVALAAAEWTGFVASAEPTPAPTAEVKIENFTFGPAVLTVTAGTTVTWTNDDDIPHAVVSDDKIFKSNALDTDEKFSYAFVEPGTYDYFCSIHPKMTGKVVVK